MTGVVVGLHALVERGLAPRKVVNVATVAALGKCWCGLYAVASFLGLLWWLSLAAREVPSSLLCGHITTESALWEAYFWSKLFEGVIDLTTVTLRFPINAHFRYHHYTTPVFAWLGWHTHSTHSFGFMGMNLFMHAMVYAFHAGAGVHVPWLRPMIRFWQNVQLLGGIGLATVAVYARGALGRPCSLDSWLGDVVPPLLFALYFVLFLDELREEAKQARKEKQ